MNTCLLNEQANKLINTQVKKSLGAAIHFLRAWPEPLGAADGNSFLFRTRELLSQPPAALVSPLQLQNCSLIPELPAWAGIIYISLECFLVASQSYKVPKKPFCSTEVFQSLRLSSSRHSPFPLCSHSTPCPPHTLTSAVSCVTVI